jgi:hypothetical protein
MSNLFKSNSRFAILAEEIEKPIKKGEKRNEKKEEENKKNSIFKENFKENCFLREESNSFKRDNQRRDYKYESKEEREKKENLKKEEDRMKKEEEAKKNLAEENFPKFLSKVTTCNNTKNAISYSEKAAQKHQKDVKQEVVENNIKPGWVEIKRDNANPSKCKIMYTYGVHSSDADIFEEPVSNSDYPVFEALVNLHNKRTKEYIDTYGYDTWEKMFRFQNFDYEYFDKLDEYYEMEEENNIEGDYI